MNELRELKTRLQLEKEEAQGMVEYSE